MTSNCTLGPYLWLIWSFLNPTSPKLSFESNIDVIKMIPKFDPKWPLHFLLLWRHNDKKMLENVQILNLLEINFHLGHITLVYLNYNKSYELFPKVSILGPLCCPGAPPVVEKWNTYQWIFQVMRNVQYTFKLTAAHGK